MTRIVRIQQPVVIPLTVSNLSISDLQAQIAELRYQKQTGAISAEEADARILVLQAKLEELENTSTPLAEPQQSETVVETPVSDIEDTPDSADSYANDDFYSLQAQNNRAFHNI